MTGMAGRQVWSREHKKRGCERGTEFFQTRSIDPCMCVALSQSNPACVAWVHTPTKPVCGRHVAGTVVLQPCLGPAQWYYNHVLDYLKKGGCGAGAPDRVKVAVDQLPVVQAAAGALEQPGAGVEDHLQVGRLPRPPPELKVSIPAYTKHKAGLVVGVLRGSLLSGLPPSRPRLARGLMGQRSSQCLRAARQRQCLGGERRGNIHKPKPQSHRATEPQRHSSYQRWSTLRH